MEDLLKPINDDFWSWFRMHVEHLLYLSTWPRKGFEGIAIHKVLMRGNLFHESIQEQSSIFNKSLVLVSSHLLGRNRRNVNSRPVPDKVVPQSVEIVVPPRPFERPLVVNSRYRVGRVGSLNWISAIPG